MTAKQISQFLNFSQSYLGENKEDSKFSYAVRKMVKRCEVVGQEHNEQVEDINMRYAATDKDSKIVLRNVDPRLGFEFTKESLLERTKELRELAKKEYDLEPYIATELPPEPLSFEEKECCYGFVLEEPKE